MANRFRTVIRGSLLAAFSLVVATGRVSAQKVDPLEKHLNKTETMIAMRDGVKLYTTVYAPKDAKGPLPFIFLRTPYGIEAYGPRALQSYLKELADEGYLFVFQDIRGRFKSEGTFVMSRMPRDKQDPKAIDEGTDTHDTIDWLVKQVPNNNGRVGMLGISYPGWLTVMGMLEPHPALKAVSPQASPADMFLGDDFHHNGAFRLSYGFEYVAMMETNKVNTNFKFDRHDTFEWYLKLGALSNVNPRYFQGKMPTWNDFVAHPNYDAFWQKQAFAPYLNQVTVPTLNVAGWFDQEDFYGPLKIYELLEKHDKKNQNFLVVGPWNHGGWAAGPGDKLGRIAFDQATGKHFREKVQAAWFAHHLKDKGTLAQPEALLFQTGTNQWVSHDRWPPKNAVDRKLYFHADGKLTFDPPPAEAKDAFDRYISDPARPVPYRPRPVTPTYPGPEWKVWMVEDQRFTHHRPDVLSYETEPLKEDVVVAGSLTANLFGATSGSDCDWIVRIIDVYPEEYAKEPGMSGYQLLISGEPIRARFRKSFEKPEAVTPHEVNEYKVDLHWSHHCFRKGHKIMVQVQSTWFPLIDRNPQKYVPNIFAAKDADFQSAEQRVHRSPRYPSRVSMQVIGAPALAPDDPASPVHPRRFGMPGEVGPTRGWYIWRRFDAERGSAEVSHEATGEKYTVRVLPWATTYRYLVYGAHPDELQPGERVNLFFAPDETQKRGYLVHFQDELCQMKGHGHAWQVESVAGDGQEFTARVMAGNKPLDDSKPATFRLDSGGRHWRAGKRVEKAELAQGDRLYMTWVYRDDARRVLLTTDDASLDVLKKTEQDAVADRLAADGLGAHVEAVEGDVARLLIFPTYWAQAGAWKQGQSLALRATTATLKSTGEPITATLLTRKNLGTYGSGATEVSVRLSTSQDAARLQAWRAGTIVRVRAR